jgi:Flp pilus assembly pilin Flp
MRVGRGPRRGQSIMLKMFKLINGVRKDEEGASMVEYAFLVTLIALVAGTAVNAMGNSVSAKFVTVNTCLTKFSTSC